ncbi:hypothetical protein GJ689_00100 [Rhodoplanes serenus]|uniref:Uncharacterized protein n=1 Tax=Rhodoplanes serenus TaxID=200615 RepID=A0A327K1K0_9BRAD|nr:hypothetical protein [Rhodoplanes serenus]MBI5110755.1 hypothetical protein [Rhodovulum sp.]MTW14615.1 hypothetical protein [Rhodoplanes serenus]RAI31703.1 hypothetical protein CH340_17870 [Rhodoplanes serenus]VCU09849.1 hypothetical protein RHODGE_RHODGE_03018 [Rhodoplanes serenus]
MHATSRTLARTLTAVALAALACVVAGESRAANPLELNFWLSGPRYDAVVPLCDEPAPLMKIQDRFGQKEYRFWNSDLKIVGFDRLHEVSFMPWASGTIPRRFCSGRVLTNDGHYRTIHYSIAEDTGMIGSTFGVEWCVVGLDRNWAFNPSCKMARP